MGLKIWLTSFSLHFSSASTDFKSPNVGQRLLMSHSCHSVLRIASESGLLIPLIGTWIRLRLRWRLWLNFWPGSTCSHRWVYGELKINQSSFVPLSKLNANTQSIILSVRPLTGMSVLNPAPESVLSGEMDSFIYVHWSGQLRINMTGERHN